MSIIGVNGALASVYQYAEETKKTAENVNSFLDQLQKTGEAAGTSKVNVYQEYLKQRYGNVIIQDVGKDQRSMDSIGAGTWGTGNVVIAPNIMEQMANDPEKAAYYEGKIRNYFDSVPRCQAELSIMGHEIHSSGIVIHADGTVTHYVTGDLKPEVRARIEAKIKAEDEAKAERKRQYQKSSQEAAEKRKREMEIAYRQQSLTGLLANQAADTGQVTYAGTPEAFISVAAAYGMSTMAISDISK